MDDLISQAQHIFTMPIFSIGNNQFSLKTIASIAFLLIVTFLISRVISQVIRRSLLAALRLDRGLQEAITSVINYLLITLGFIIVLQSAGINLSSITVVAGVLGIGLGFGLQNLTSNFISGVVILFEQKIRVGDYVEINGLFGTVEKISIRSTIVRTNDDVFVIVPNLRFIENNTLNWSYGGHRCRISIPVGVAYGTDPLLLTEVLLAAARAEPRVLSNPPSEVWFDSFGESCLKFKLLVWIDRPHESEPIKSALNFLIEYELRHRGIEIPFPQLDLRVRNIEALNGLLQRDHGIAAKPEIDITDSKKQTSKSFSNHTLRDLLRRVTYFEKCTDSELLALIANGYRQTFPPNYIVCKEDEPSDCFYIILSGTVEVISKRAEKYIATLHEGDFFGEISLLTGTPRTATVQTFNETILFVVDRLQLQRLLFNHKNLAEQIALTLSERQQTLISLGLLNEDDLKKSGETALMWVRRRLNLLFGVELDK